MGRILVLLALLLLACVANGFTMLFGKKQAKPSNKGVQITVKQKYFKDTDVTLPGPTNMRKALMAQNIEIYPLQGKIYNCGGGGSCGTCAVAVLDGMENLSPKGPAEVKLLGKKPESFRLSCCTMVKGPCTVQTKP